MAGAARRRRAGRAGPRFAGAHRPHKTLAERYATPLPALAADVAVLTARVDAHLAKMGFAC